MIEGLISLIVPVYNVEKYIDKCVQSILEQSYSDIELILVDDGSTDGSGEKCDNWVEKDSRVIVIHKENSGSADSRNKGIDASNGEYIGFIDSDDWIAPDMYQKLLEALKSSDADISMCDYIEAKNDSVVGHCNGEHRAYTGREMAELIISNRIPKISYSIWKCLFKRDTIGDIRLVKGINYCEDGVFLLETLWKAAHVEYVNEELYYYRIHDESISATISQKRISDILFKCDWLLTRYTENGTEAEIQTVKAAIIDELVSYRRRCFENKDTITSANTIDKYLKDNHLSISNVACTKKALVKYIMYRYLISVPFIRNAIAYRQSRKATN